MLNFAELFEDAFDVFLGHVAGKRADEDLAAVVVSKNTIITRITVICLPWSIRKFASALVPLLGFWFWLLDFDRLRFGLDRLDRDWLRCLDGDWSWSSSGSTAAHSSCPRDRTSRLWWLNWRFGDFDGFWRGRNWLWF